METLSEQQQELIRKMSDDRLKQSLLKAGLPLAAINVRDRQALISAWTEMVVSERDKPVAGAIIQPILDPELERRRLEFEECKWAEQAKIEADKIQLKKEKLRPHVETYDSPASLFKRYGDALRGTLGRMPTNAADLSAFFENAERIFREIKHHE